MSRSIPCHGPRTWRASISPHVSLCGLGAYRNRAALCACQSHDIGALRWRIGSQAWLGLNEQSLWRCVRRLLLTADILAPVPHRHWTFSIPRVLRGLVERDRKLLGLLSQTAYASILQTFQALLDRDDVRPGCVVSLQTHGAYAANWNPHAHALVSDGVFSPEGEFLPLSSLDTTAVMEVFRRLLLERLHQAERLSETFMHNLLSWVHPGFSVFAGPPVDGAALTSLESQGRYITRPALAMDALEKCDDGNLALETPPDPRSGSTRLVLDPLSVDSQDYTPHTRCWDALPTILRRLLEPGQSRKILRGR